MISDPMERLIADALDAAGIAYEHEKLGLDFYLPSHDLYIEVKRFHSPRISAQMGRVSSIIAVQGKLAVEAMASLIRSGKF